MSDDARGSGSASWREWLPALSAAALLIGAAFFQGGLASQQVETIRRVGALETRIETLQLIDVRTARMETKLDMLTAGDARPARDQRGRSVVP